MPLYRTWGNWSALETEASVCNYQSACLPISTPKYEPENLCKWLNSAVFWLPQNYVAIPFLINTCCIEVKKQNKTFLCLSDKYVSMIFGSNWLCLFMNGPVSGLMGWADNSCVVLWLLFLPVLFVFFPLEKVERSWVTRTCEKHWIKAIKVDFSDQISISHFMELH